MAAAKEGYWIEMEPMARKNVQFTNKVYRRQPCENFICFYS